MSTESRIERNALWIAVLNRDQDSYLYTPHNQKSESVLNAEGQIPWSRVIGGSSVQIKASGPTTRIDLHLRMIAKRYGIERIHVVGEPWGLPAHIALRSAKHVVIHGAENNYLQGNLVKDAWRVALTKRNLKKVVGFVGWHSFAVNAAKESGLPDQTPTLIAPGQLPESQTFMSKRDNDFKSHEKLRVIFVGRLVQEKGVDVLIRSLSGFTGEVHLTVVGKGDEELNLRKLATALKVDTMFAGWLDSPRLATLMQASHVIAVPSRSTKRVREQFGLAPLEGMLTGLPVLAAKVGALPDLVGAGGLFFDDGDEEALSKIISDLLRDRGRVSELSKLALLRGQDFSPGVVAKAITDFWVSCER